MDAGLSIQSGAAEAAGHDTYSGWFDEHIGATLADSGALGLAGQIKASMNQPPPSEG